MEDEVWLAFEKKPEAVDSTIDGGAGDFGEGWTWAWVGLIGILSHSQQREIKNFIYNKK